MKDTARELVMASFVADSLSLGVHWIYDTERLKKAFGRVDHLLKPGPDSYHATKDRGDLTHYGDQAFTLMESLAIRKGFDPTDFSMRWKALFKDYSGYYDQATKGTLHNLSQGKGPDEAGSSSEDLAGASRISPLVFRYRNDPNTLVEASRAQTAMTHNTPLVIDIAEFFARTSWMVLEGASPVSAMEEVSNDRFGTSPISNWVEMGIQSKEMESVATIVRFGQDCRVDHAFPGTVHLICKYERDLKEALVQSVMAGGDSAARGMMAGMVLGAYLGEEGLPDQWVSGLNRKTEILKLLDMMGGAVR
jgi:ADP-ribosylglycohydrolase